MEILLEFSGGLDTLTINQIKELKLRLKCVDGIDVNLGHLIAYIRRVIIGSKKDLFSYMPIINGNDLNFIDIECDLDIFNGKLNINESCKIRPGVLVLVDDIDWELLGTENHKLIDKQNITFISTLHGG